MYKSQPTLFRSVIIVAFTVLAAVPAAEPSAGVQGLLAVPVYPETERDLPMSRFQIDASIGIPDLDLIYQQFKRLRLRPDLDEIKDALKGCNLAEQPDVCRHLHWARTGSTHTQQRAKFWLIKQILDYQLLARELNDPHMPYATIEQIGNRGRGIHILDQMHNQVPMYIDPFDDFVLAGLCLGAPQGGKTSAAYVVARQFPGPVLTLDPKNAWRPWASALSAKVIERGYSLDLAKPENSNVSEEDWLFAEMQAIAQVTGLQYGQDCLFEACTLALAQRHEYQTQWGVDTPLCLQDIALCLPLTGFKGSRRSDYLASAQTALSLILGKNELFTTREGLPMERIFQGNYILPCYHLNTWQCRYLAVHLMNYRHFATLGQPERTSTTNLLIVDDASNFASKPQSVFGASSSISPYHYLLKTLRSSGTGWLFLDQTPTTIAEDIRRLCNFWLITGRVTGARNHAEVASALSLTPEQGQYLGYLQTRECVAYCPHYWPRPVHGLVPDRSQYM